MISIAGNDDDFSPEEFALLEEALKEAALIKNGMAQPIPASELWND